MKRFRIRGIDASAASDIAGRAGLSSKPGDCPVNAAAASYGKIPPYWGRLYCLNRGGKHASERVGLMTPMTGSTEKQLHAALDGRLDGYLRTDPASRSLWSTDASIYQRRPIGVIVARSEGDVRRTLSAARDLDLPITPRGGGTSLASPSVRILRPRSRRLWAA
jgi:hypothetical protein